MEEYDENFIFDIAYSSLTDEVPRKPINNLLEEGTVYEELILNIWPDSLVSADPSVIQDVNSSVYNQTTTNIVCSLVFPLLSFFHFAKLERISSHFKIPIYRYLKKNFLNKKRLLFENFDLKFFLMNIDKNMDVFEKPNPITLYELNFIFKHFSFVMKEINIQVDFLKKTREVIEEDDCRSVDDVVTTIARNFGCRDNKLNISLYGHNIREFYMNGGSATLIDIQHEISSELLSLKLMGHAFLQELKLLTYYSDTVQYTVIIEFLRNIKVFALDIKGASESFNRNCDTIIEVCTIKSLHSLTRIKIHSCHSENLFGLLKKFNNLREMSLDNVTFRNDDLCFPKLKKVFIANSNFIDDLFLYDLINQNPNLEELEISNCDSINGSFMVEINQLARRKKLKVDLTNLRKEFLFSVEKTQITNQLIEFSCNKYDNFNSEHIDKLLEDIYDEENYSNESSGLISELAIPYGFNRVLKEYFRSGSDYHLDLREFHDLDKNCLKYISSLSRVDTLSLFTYYPKVAYKEFVEFLKDFKLKVLNIYGYKYTDYTDVTNSCYYLLQNICLSNIIDEPSKLMLLNVYGLCKICGEKLRYSNIEIIDCPELTDEICDSIIKNCSILQVLEIKKCNNVTGNFINQVDKMRKIKIIIEDSYALVNYIDKEIPNNHNVIFNVFLINDGAKNENEIQKPNTFIYDNKYFSKVLHLRHLKKLVVSTYYSNVNGLQNLYLLNIEDLTLTNDKLYENDSTDEILLNFAKNNPNCLINLILEKCKITEQGITSINKLLELEHLVLDNIYNLNNELIEQLLLGNLANLKYLEIPNNDELNDLTWEIIMKKICFLDELSIANCSKITKNIFEYSKTTNMMYRFLNISGTAAGYYCLLNPSFKPLVEFKQSIEIDILLNNVNVDYLRLILNETVEKRLTELPAVLISSFTQHDSLDLREFNELNEESFLLISQLQELGTLAVRSFYKNVSNCRQMLNNLSKLNLHTLVIEGYSENCDSEQSSILLDILELFSINQKKCVVEISIINCPITNDVIETLCYFKHLCVLRISNIAIELNTADIMKSFKSNDKTLHGLYVNGSIIQDTTLNNRNYLTIGNKRLKTDNII